MLVDPSDEDPLFWSVGAFIFGSSKIPNTLSPLPPKQLPATTLRRSFDPKPTLRQGPRVLCWHLGEPDLSGIVIAFVNEKGGA